MSVSEDIAQRFSRVPANNELGFTLLSRSPDKVSVSMKVRPEYIQETGVVHGGILAAMADTAAVYLFFPDLDRDESMGCVEFKVNYLRPALLEEGAVVATSKVVQRGRKIGVSEVEVSQSGKLVAKGLFTYVFFERTS